MKIPQEDIDRVFAAAKIEEVVGDYVSLKRRGANLIGLCPFHQEKTGSFTVSPAKGIYKCFGCGKSGHAIGFVMDIEQCGFIDAVRQVAKRYNIQITERELTADEQQRQDDRESMFIVNDYANRWFQDQLWNTQEGQIAGLQYFRERGLTDQTIREYGLGYSPERGNPLAGDLKKAGFIEKYIVADPNAKERQQQPGTGLCGKSEDGRIYDRFRGRVMFPIHTVSGKIVAFAGRIIKKNDNVGKYVNSPDSIIYSKTNELYGLYLAKHAIAKADLCYMVEGQMDVISMHQAGIANVVCSGGTALTKEQIRLIQRFTNNITVIYDGDAAGIHAALRGIDMFLEQGFNVKVLLLPDGHDPDSFARTHNASDFIDYINQNQVDFIRFKIRLLSAEAGRDPNKRAELIRDIIQSIAQIPDPITRQVYIQDASARLNMSEHLLTRTMSQIRLEKQQEVQKKQEQQKRMSQLNELAEAAPVTNEASVSETTPITQNQPKLSIVEQNFRNLLQVIVRYGQEPLYPMQTGNSISVGDFIISQIQNDGAAPCPLYQRILDEYRTHCKEPGFVAAEYFKTHMDPEISQFAISLIADQYQLSRMFSKQSVSENVKHDVKPVTDADRLPELVLQLIYEYKYTIVNQRIDNIDIQLRQATDNIDQQMQLLAARQSMLNVKNQLAKLLGNRVIT